MSNDVLSWASELRGEPESGASRALYVARSAIVDAIDQAVGYRMPTLLVKGAGLSLTAYASPWIRPMSDIDLLVRPARLEELARLLEANGFRRVVDPARPRTTALLELIMLAPKPLPDIAIELHGSLDKIAPRDLAVETLWERGFPHGVGLMRAPSLEDHLVLVAIHLANDEFAHALGLADIDALLRAGANVDLAMSRAEACGARTALRISLDAMYARRGEPRDRARDGGWRDRLVSRWFDPSGWPIGKTPVELGWRWVAKQAVLRDDSVSFARGVLRYGEMRGLEKVQRLLGRS